MHTQRPLARKRELIILLAACCLSLLVVSPLLVLSDDQILDRHGSDDLFYFLQLAQHSAPLSTWLAPHEEPIISFDGIHPTNGVQPAWWAITSALAQVFGRELQLRGLLAVAVLLHLAAGILLFLWLSKLGLGQAIALIAATVWILHPRPMSTALEGTEAGLLAFAWALSLWLWTQEQSSGPSFTERPPRTFLLGLALALGVLTRIDFILPAIALSWFGPCNQALARRRSSSQMVPIAVPWIIALACWIALSVASTGSPFPDSGSAKALHRQILETSVNEVRIACDTDSSLAPVFSENRFANPPTLVSGAKLIIQHLSHNGSSSTLFAILFLVSGVAFFSRRHSAFSLARTIAKAAWPLALGLPLAVLYLSTLGYVRSWYLVPLALLHTLVAAALCAVLSGVLCSALRAFLRPRGPILNRHTATAVVLAAWLAAAHWEARLSPATPYNGAVYRFVSSIRELVPQGARIGAFNAGIPSFVFDQRNSVVNLDGVVNHTARAALDSGTLANYLVAEDVHFIVDLDTTIKFFEQHSCSTWSQNFQVIAKSAPLSPGSDTRLVLLRRNPKAPVQLAP